MRGLSVRWKIDPAWEHIYFKKEGRTNVYTCLHCSTVYKGGGINKMKQHLAGVFSQITSCEKVPCDVRCKMKENLKEVSRKKKLDGMHECYGDEEGCEVVDVDLSLTPIRIVTPHNCGKRKAFKGVSNYCSPRITPSSKPSFKNVLSSKEAQLKANMAISQWCVDASDLVKDAKTLFSLFREVIEWIGPKNIVHVVTDNTTNYVACGKLIHDKYKHIYWSPYAANCLNLILKDIASMPYVSDLASKASKLTMFVYNHAIFLSWLKKRESWGEIVLSGETKFSTTFITLRSIYEHKIDLQAFATDKYFTNNKLSKTATRKAFHAIVLDNKFWDDCYDIVILVGPFFGC
ncbi:uncharacterized protein LOC129314129 [Prosopis cineraria]|uniref:uncharacterized protein LOC129314129 n=1 Tax=Prosopis cineraria TaxID=364024 RepID=UPI00240F4CAB|nr:uncharacterized protein LOC129314129 [Prosopis cineraria]